VLSLKIFGEEGVAMNRIEKIRSKFKTYSIDALLITTPENRRYASGFHSTDGVVLITKDAAFLFVDSRYIEAAQNKAAGFTIELIDLQNSYKRRISEALKGKGCSCVGFEDACMSYAEYIRYSSEIINLPMKPASRLLNELRRTKDGEELESLIAAQRIAERALDDVLGIIKPGVTEREVAAEITYRMLKYGAENNSFDPIVVTGTKSSMPHGMPGDEKIESGHFVTMDFGCIYNGYCSDMTRTVAVGSANDEMKKIYDIVLEAQLAGIAAARAGVKGRDIDAAARNVISDAGFGPYFGHSFGHGVGLHIHEEPNAGPTSDAEMHIGAVISAEPGIYLPGRFGVRIEDVIIIEENGCKNITLAKKELIIL